MRGQAVGAPGRRIAGMIRGASRAWSDSRDPDTSIATKGGDRGGAGLVGGVRVPQRIAGMV